MPRMLLPREHGAYVQLLAPLVLALAATRGATAAAWLLALAACCAFVANEPLLVVLGHRGKRAADRDHAQATRMLAVLAPAAIATGGAGLWLAPPARPFAAAVSVLAIALVAMGWRKQQRTLAGETIALGALTGAGAIVAAAAGMPGRPVLLLWLAWIVGFGCTILGVHRVIERGKAPRATFDVATALVFAGAGVALAIFAARDWMLVAGSPLALGAAAVAFVAPPPAKLRTIGFAMVGASLVSIALVLAV